jgi:serine/threonine protein kinase
MSLTDEVIDHLRDVIDLPDLAGTRYELVRRLGRGGMGTVYLVSDTVLEREVALKVLAAPDPSGELAARFRSESLILARLEHPNIVPIHDAGILADGRVYYAMKLVRGARLDEWKASATRTRNDVLRLFQKICEAVAFAHAHGVIHRDLKPQNIMIGPFGEALVMDWGVAKVIAAPNEHGAALGTPGYMSPEQARGDAVDARTDVYALGAILRCLLEGAPHPRTLDAICGAAMATAPSERYVTVESLAADIGRFLDGARVMAHRESVLEKTARVVARNRTVVLLVLAYLAMRVLVLFFADR